jgi:hypothetical protein
MSACGVKFPASIHQPASRRGHDLNPPPSSPALFERYSDVNIVCKVGTLGKMYICERVMLNFEPE